MRHTLSAQLSFENCTMSWEMSEASENRRNDSSAVDGRET